MENYREIQVWLYPLVYLFLLVFCLVKIKRPGRKLLALAFGALILSTMSWRLLNLFEIGVYDSYAYYDMLNIGNLLLFLVFAGLMTAGISRVSVGRASDSGKNQPKEDVFQLHPFWRSGDNSEVIDIKPLRVRGERLMIFILSLISAVVILLLFILGLHEPSLFLTFGLIIGFVTFGLYISARLIRGQVLGNSIKVTPGQFPEIYEIKINIMRRLNFEYETEIYVVEDGSLNAFLSKFIATRFIVLNSGLVNAMLTEKNWKELEFIIARAIGHLKAKHFRFWLLQVLISLEKLNPLLYFAYERMCHYSSDRIGMVVCGDQQAAINALIKLAVGDKLQKTVYLDNVNLQYFELNHSFGATIAEWFLKHPHLIKRIYKLTEFGNGGLESADRMREAIAPDDSTRVKERRGHFVTERS